jgi:hypothetical protein
MLRLVFSRWVAMLRRAIFSSPSGRLLERGSIDHAIRVEHDQIDEDFWLKHAAVGKPQAPGRRSVIPKKIPSCRRFGLFFWTPSR